MFFFSRLLLILIIISNSYPTIELSFLAGVKLVVSYGAGYVTALRGKFDDPSRYKSITINNQITNNAPEEAARRGENASTLLQDQAKV
jgi:hypothetical protein